jgi:hypothetical protein
VLLVVVFKLLPVSELDEPYNLSTEAGQQAHANSMAKTGDAKESAGSTTVSHPADNDDDVD